MRKSDNTVEPMRALIAAYCQMREGSTERFTAQLLLEHILEIPQMTREEIAALCAISQSTLNRFCHDLGYTSITDFRDKVERDLRARQVHPPFDPSRCGNQVAAQLDSLEHSLKAFRAVCTQEQMEFFAAQLHEARKVYFFDPVFSTLRLPLMTSLVQSGKMIAYASHLASMEEEIAGMQPQDLVVVFCHRGKRLENQRSIARAAAKTGAKVYALDSQSWQAPENLKVLDLPFTDGLTDLLLSDLWCGVLHTIYAEKYLSHFRYTPEDA